MRTKETALTQRDRVEATQRAGTRLAIFLLLLLFFLSKVQEREFIFISIKYSNLSSSVVLCCNPTIQMNQINSLK